MKLFPLFCFSFVGVGRQKLFLRAFSFAASSSKAFHKRRPFSVIGKHTDSLLDAGLKDEAEQKGEKNARSGREREREREKKKKSDVEREDFFVFWNF